LPTVAEPFFSLNFAAAREKFLAACAREGLGVVSYRHSKSGPDGGALFTDVTRIGPVDAERVLVVESGTHGVEGYAGSGIQIGLLSAAGAPRPPAGVALVLVHALNPYGFAWTRRVNEDNIDLNRSFVDHAGGRYPDNPGYAALADAIVPREWTAKSRKAADAVMQAYAARHGEDELRTAFKRGQHTHPLGLFYGGRAPTWSAGTLKKICDDFLAAAKRAALIDIHTGLGPFGYGECLTPCAPDSAEGQRATAWYGDVRHTMDKDSGYSGSQGTVVNGYMWAKPGIEWTCIGLEFGTRPQPHMREKLRAEGWLHAYGGADHPDAARIKAELRDSFYPNEPEWKPLVLARGLEIVARGLKGLAAS
jgi:hypothetical protein